MEAWKGKGPAVAPAARTGGYTREDSGQQRSGGNGVRVLTEDRARETEWASPNNEAPAPVPLLAPDLLVWERSQDQG